MKRIMLTVAYDGTEYSGWQIQPGKITIEGVLNEELSRVLNEDIKVIGASRTDSGVHAEGAVCVFDTKSSIPGDKFSYALNRSLPSDIVIMDSREVSSDFHPRKVNCRKTYRYSLWNDKFILPTKKRYYHHIYTNLDIDVMCEAAKAFVGEHDFAAFCSTGSQATTTVRTIYSMNVIKKDKEISIEVCGNGFLYNMVRIIAGTLIEAGQGKYSPSDIEKMLESGQRNNAGQTAPANGLCLVKYEFDE